MTAKDSISVVIPVFNGALTLPSLVQRLRPVLAGHASQAEIILVNDGSRDNSWTVIGELAARYDEVRGLNLMRNYGQHSALLAGIQRAQYEVIVTLDDDLQHPPEELPKLLAKLAEGYDLVYGKPQERCHSAWRNLSSNVLMLVLKLVLGAEMAHHNSAFRAFRAILACGFRQFTDAQLSLDVLLSWSVGRVTHVPVAHHPRRVGRSGYTLTKLGLLAFNMLTGYSSLPLRVASGVGLLTAMLGVAMFLYVVIQRLLQTTYVPGFAFLAAEVALFTGMQLFAVGVIGEYIARLHFRTMGQPPYVIREEVSRESLLMSPPPAVVETEKLTGAATASHIWVPTLRR